jgi:aminopeptidase-like protein
MNHNKDEMRRIITKYATLNRVPVGDDTTMFVRELAAELGVSVMSLPSGTECLTWVIPDKWTVHEAYIETLDGRRIADFNLHPIYLHAHSASFSGIVSRRELLSHIGINQKHDERLNYVCRWQFSLEEHQNWAFSLPARTVRELRDDAYFVSINTEFSKGTLDIIDWVLPGKQTETVFFSAHSCHPGQVNDGLACIAVLVQLFRYLERIPNRKYTYRLIIGPEYFAAAAILQYGHGIDQLKYGLYLDMMANENPISFSQSFIGNTYIDKAVRNVLNKQEDGHTETRYRGLYGNDEMFYDGPGFDIPTVGLARYPFEHYHTEYDDIAHCDFDKLEESLDYLIAIVDVLERDFIPRRTYKGPLFLSRYGLYIDFKTNPAGYRQLQEIQILMDGERSCLEIADAIGADFGFVHDFVEKLCKLGLASIQGTPAKMEAIT